MTGIKGCDIHPSCRVLFNGADITFYLQELAVDVREPESQLLRSPMQLGSWQELLSKTRCVNSGVDLIFIGLN